MPTNARAPTASYEALPAVILCDDDPLVHQTLALYLRGRANLLHVDGQAGLLRALPRHPTAVVLLDVCLGGGPGGLDTLAQVRAAFPAAPVVLFTGTDDADTAAQALRLGAVDVLAKGQGLGGLQQALARWAPTAAAATS